MGRPCLLSVLRHLVLSEISSLMRNSVFTITGLWLLGRHA